MDAAFRVFAERGYRATRLDEVAEAVGVTGLAVTHVHPVDVERPHAEKRRR